VSLPPARTPGRYVVELVCLGNICRSPTAHVVLEDRLATAGLDRVEVRSSGTGGWHVGEPMDPRAAATLSDAGYDPTRHRARQHAVPVAADGADLVLAMDGANRRDLLAAGVEPDRLGLFRDHDPVGTGGDVPDPWPGGDEGFAEVLAMVERTADALVDELAAQRPWERP
jgi:protein-tyrosine phosphatase